MLNFASCALIGPGARSCSHQVRLLCSSLPSALTLTYISNVFSAGGLGVIGGVGYTPKFLRQQIQLLKKCVQVHPTLSLSPFYTFALFHLRVHLAKHIPSLVGWSEQLLTHDASSLRTGT